MLLLLLFQLPFIRFQFGCVDRTFIDFSVSHKKKCVYVHLYNNTVFSQPNQIKIDKEEKKNVDEKKIFSFKSKKKRKKKNKNILCIKTLYFHSFYGIVLQCHWSWNVCVAITFFFAFASRFFPWKKWNKQKKNDLKR